MPRLTNAQLVAKAHEYRLAVTTAKTAKAKADGIRDEVLAELARRKVTEFTGAGITIARKVKRTRRFSIDVLRRLHPSIYSQVAPPTVQATVFDQLKKAGTIPADIAEAAVVGHDESAPWIDVSPAA